MSPHRGQVKVRAVREGIHSQVFTGKLSLFDAFSHVGGLPLLCKSLFGGICGIVERISSSADDGISVAEGRAVVAVLVVSGVVPTDVESLQQCLCQSFLDEFIDSVSLPRGPVSRLPSRDVLNLLVEREFVFSVSSEGPTKDECGEGK